MTLDPITDEALPPEYGWGFVTARVIQAVADTTADADRDPQARPASGRVVFIPTETRRKVTTSPHKAFVAHAMFEARLNARGQLIDAEGQPGIALLEGEWTADFRLDSGLSIPRFAFHVGPEHTAEAPLDLVDVAPYDPPARVTVQTVLVPSGGREGDVLTLGTGGRLAWTAQTGGGGGVDVGQAVEDYLAANPPDVATAVADYLTANPPASAPDATTAAKGLIRLAGDLGGTADAPTVPGLSSRIASVEGILADGGTGSGIRNVSGTVTLDAAPGLCEVYALDAATVNGVGLAAGDAAVFRYLSGAWSWMIVGQHTTWQAPEPTEPTAVTATAPTFTDVDGTANDRYVIPAMTGVEYRKGGAAIAAGTYTPTAGESVTITAVALAGYTLTGSTSWSKTFSTSTAPINITATAPTRDDTANTYTIPTSTGVEYLVDGVVKAAGTYPVGDVDQTVTVTARALSGYTLTGTSSWSLVFTTSAPALTPEEAALALSPLVYLPLDDAEAGTLRNLGSSTVRFTTSTTTPQPVFGAPTIGGRGTSVDFTSAEANSWVGSKVGFGDRGHLWGTELVEFSISLRVNLTDVTTDQWLFNVAGINDGGGGVLVAEARLIGGQLYVVDGTGSQFVVSKLAVGAHTITATSKIGGNTSLYIDGQLKHARESPATLYAKSTGISVGGRGRVPKGRVSDFIFTTSEITAEQVATLHASYGESA